jgi:enediyne biosynthesis protein E4
MKVFYSAAISAAVVLALSSPASPPPPLPTFTDIAASAGIRFQHTSGSPEKRYIFEAKGGGVCLLDLYFVNGSTLEDLQRGVAHPNALYRADGHGGYTDVTSAAGVGGGGWGMGCTVGDYDNDGWPDLYVLGLDGNILYRNQHDGRFADLTAKGGVAVGRWSTSAAFLDYDRDGDLDLYVASNIRVDARRSPPSLPAPECNYRGARVMCGPRGLPGSQDVLFRNNGDGTFTDVTAAAGLLESHPAYGLGVAIGDVNNDGWPDIYVANDSMPSYLYLNKRDGTFEEAALLAGVAVSDDGMEQAGMGTDWGDYDNDGWLDLTKTNFAFEANNLYRNEHDGRFADQATKAGLAAPSYPLVGWGTKFLDYDNDGWKDIVVANGHVYPHLRKNPPGGETYEQRRLLFRNQGDGRFADVTGASGPGFQEERSSRGLAVGDLDNDGDVDIVIVNLDGTPSVLRNESGNARHWLTLRLHGTASNRFGIGARVTARAGSLVQTAEATTAGSIFSASDSRIHFGVGDATNADLEIRWPSGKVQTIQGAAADRIVDVDEERGLVEAVVPPAGSGDRSLH